jgi:GTP cyclohydrolase II
VVGTTTNRSQRNVIGTHSGSYGVYRALAVAAGNLTRGHRADLTDTAPTDPIGPHPQWGDPRKIVSLDPWGASVQRVYADYLAAGYDIRPTIAVTKAHIHLPEIKQAIAFQRLAIDGRVLLDDASAVVTKVAVEPVWWLPGVARALQGERGRPAPRAVRGNRRHVPRARHAQRPRGLPAAHRRADAVRVRRRRDLANPAVTLTARVHDECNGSDVFGSDICTCRPYLTHAIEECIRGAQAGGVGLIAYSRKEGRALGEVTKFLVYNARKRQLGGDSADKYFLRTECVAGVQDMRFQELMPDVLHWLGIRKIHRLVSMSNDKYDAITGSGIEVGERVKIPDALVPADAKVEIEAKIAAGYFTDGAVPTDADLAQVKGRALSEPT